MGGSMRRWRGEGEREGRRREEKLRMGVGRRVQLRSRAGFFFLRRAQSRVGPGGARAGWRYLAVAVAVAKGTLRRRRVVSPVPDCDILIYDLRDVTFLYTRTRERTRGAKRGTHQ